VDTWVGHRCYFDTRARIEIGRFAPSGRSHALHLDPRPGNHECRVGPFVGGPIVVGDGSWIGTRATVLAGVTVGDGCVIAAGAVVTDDCEPDGLYVGVPARRVRDL